MRKALYAVKGGDLRLNAASRSFNIPKATMKSRLDGKNDKNSKNSKDGKNSYDQRYFVHSNVVTE